MELGLSIYPSKTSLEEMKNYLELAKQYDFKHIFTSMLGVDLTTTDYDKIKEINDFAKNLDYSIMIDVNPEIFHKLDIQTTNLSFFNKLNIDMIRLDEGFSGIEESIMTYNEYNINIVGNISNDISHANNVLDHQVNMDNVSGCHNFYPLKNSALGLKYFENSTKRFEKLNLKTSAFVSSQIGKVGPGYCECGLPTLEFCREMKIKNQVKFFKYCTNIDVLYIGNYAANEEELKDMFEVNNSPVMTLDVKPEYDLENEKLIIEMLHFNRGDINEYFMRSTQPRVMLDVDIKPQNVKETLCKGDVVIINNKLKEYHKELQIIRIDQESFEYNNVVGKIDQENLILLDYIKPWSKFQLKLGE